MIMNYKTYIPIIIIILSIISLIFLHYISTKLNVNAKNIETIASQLCVDDIEIMTLQNGLWQIEKYASKDDERCRLLKK